MKVVDVGMRTGIGTGGANALVAMQGHNTSILTLYMHAGLHRGGEGIISPHMQDWLAFLPDPVPGSDGHYKSFETVYPLQKNHHSEKRKVLAVFNLLV